MADGLREQIIAGSVEALRDLGIRGFSMDAAALRSGVSRKTLYNYFASRLELLDAVFEGSFKATIASLEAIARDQGLDFVTKLNRVTEEGFRRVRESSRLFRQGGGPSIHPRSASLYREFRRSLLSLISGIVEEGAKLGYVRADVDHRKLTYVVINMVEGLLYLDDPEDEPFTRPEILQESIKILFLGAASPLGAESLSSYSFLSPPEAVP